MPRLTPILIEAHNPSPMTGRGNNTYLLWGSDGAALVDAGVGDPAHLAAVASALHTHGRILQDVLVTHGHRDHASGASALAAAHPHARLIKFPWPEEDAAYGVDWQYVDADTLLRVGDLDIAALHTPGHSPDHVVFWHEPSRTAFTGDLVIQGGSVMIHSSRGGDLAAYLASLERLLALDPSVLYPAHGPVIDEPSSVLTAHLEHRRSRERQVIEALARGRTTVRAIADLIYDGLDPALMPAACENVRAHLQKLRAEGIARYEHDRWSI